MSVHLPNLVLIADPGDTQAIHVPRTGHSHCPLVTAAAETRTMAAPKFDGQQCLLMMKTDAGDCVVTFAVPVNQAGVLTLTFANEGDFALLMGSRSGSSLVWRTIAADGPALNSGSDITLSGTARPAGFNALPERLELKWVAGAEGKPGINADFVSATEAVNTVTNRHFEILGTNASSDDVTYGAEGGITFTTDGADGDGVILLPHLDANQTNWTSVTWGTDQEVIWECDIVTGGAITNSIVWAGLKLTNTDVIATDADQIFFRYENGVSAGVWIVASSIANVDTSTVSTITVGVSTRYYLKIIIAADRTAKAYINDVLIVTTAALTDAIDLIPYIAVEADGAAEAKTLDIYGQSISRKFGA